MNLIVGILWILIIAIITIRLNSQANKIIEMEYIHKKMEFLLCHMIQSHPELYPDIVIKDEKELDEK